MNILVTGAAGWTAESILDRIVESGRTVIGADLPAAIASAAKRPGVRWLGVDVANADAVDAVVGSGVEGIVHLAVAVGADDYDRPDVPFRTNVLGAYNVLDAAQRYGVDRVVLMSSAWVHLPDPARGADPLAWRSSAGADHLYDLTKRLQEETARDFAETLGLAVTVLRAGHIVDGRADVDPHGRPLAEVTYCRGGWVCRYDLANAVAAALRGSASGFEVFNIVGSLAARMRFDVDRTERELGITIERRFGTSRA